ncbi:prolyl oligopeptidase family serine peptidase [Actinoallomurus purpureus]|uniref:S9 family peptidase n=1 Tax=Actinoallomurus purpureus TaxID=478114 RepID=UPI002093527D|nr:prolyl oligopeptidase family serine peptidase [Actinoallomurus purpureus]MCO6010356.1 prolyl oligopeptidase family serine peptidase [Actinoallomurus purpureus]
MFAGVAIDSGGPRCWLADVVARSVTFLGPVPALPPFDEAPLAWAGSSLAVPVDPSPGPRDPMTAPGDATHPVFERVFAATPGERVRVLKDAPHPAYHPFRFVALDPGRGTAGPISLDTRPYQRVRGTSTGHVAACAPAVTGRAVVAVGIPGSADEHLIQVDEGPVLEFCWVEAVRPAPPHGPRRAGGRTPTTARAAHLVTVTGHPDGFAITSYAMADGAVEPGRPLHRHRGRYLHAHRQDGLFVLALDADGSYTVLVVDPGAPRPVRCLALGLRPPTLIKIAAVAPRSAAAGRRFATVDAANNLVVWEVPDEGAVASRLFDLAVPEDEEPITLAGWDPGDVRTVRDRRRVRSPLPAHPGGRPPLHGRIAEADAEFTLHLPTRRDPAAVLVWLSQAGEAIPAGSSTLDPYGLTLAGYGVLDLRIVPGWPPGVTDEEIRPRLVRQIREAVLGSGVAEHAGPSLLAVGGASFGATLALLAIADCDLFSTAIVQSGAYSRQLTLLGFQDETRTLWEAPRVYADFDAIVNAPRIRRPVLIIHGEADPNPATPVLQATLLFQALIANGTRARLVLLPGEGHSPRSRDGIAAALAEKADWLAMMGASPI